MIQLIGIRICSPDKDFSANTLAGIYRNPMLQAFFRKMHELNLTYGVFSRKNGIQIEGNNHHAYPSIEEISDNALFDLIKSQYEQFKEITFLYWNHRPLTHSKYVNMMRMAGFKVIEFRTLKEFENLDEKIIPFLKSNNQQKEKLSNEV